MKIVRLAVLFFAFSGSCLAQLFSGAQVLENAFKAREELKNFDVGYRVTKTTISVKEKSGKKVKATRYFVSEKEFVFAVLKRGGEARFLRARFQRKNTGVYTPEMEDPYCSIVKIGAAVGVSEQFSINCGEGQELILATLRAAVPNGLVSSVASINSQFEKAIYSAYYDHLVFPEVVASGRDYIEIPIAEARDELTRLGVRSLAFPDMLVTDVFTKSSNVVDLSVIEHIDHDEIKFMGTMYSGEKVFTQFALNREATFKYATSRVGALCLMQIMPGTYGDMRRYFPKARLPKSARDFVCASHKNAVMVAILVLDHKLSDMPEEFQKNFLQDPDAHFVYLAAAYNGGAGRARALYAAMKPEKLDEILKDFYSVFKPGKGQFRAMRTETWIFVKKYMEISKSFTGNQDSQEEMDVEAEPEAEMEVKTEDRPE